MTTATDTGEFGPEQMRQLEALAPSHAKIVRTMQRQARRDAKAKPERKRDDAGDYGVPELTIDLESFMERLNVGDLEDIERVTGVPALAMSFFGGPRTSISGTAALIWVLRRKEDRRYTYKMAREIPLPDLLAAMNAMNAGSDQDENGEPEAVADPLASGDSALPSA